MPIRTSYRQKQTQSSEWQRRRCVSVRRAGRLENQVSAAGCPASLTLPGPHAWCEPPGTETKPPSNTEEQLRPKPPQPIGSATYWLIGLLEVEGCFKVFQYPFVSVLLIPKPPPEGFADQLLIHKRLRHQVKVYTVKKNKWLNWMCTSFSPTTGLWQKATRLLGCLVWPFIIPLT